MYALDANVFIQAKNSHYGFDFCPAYWDWLDQAFAAKRVVSIAEIREELKDGGDDLARWITARSHYFTDLDEAAAASLPIVAAWANSAGTYWSPAKAEFLAKADYFLVCCAHAHGLTVVTHEVSRTDSKKRIMIPEACAAVNVPCINPYDMLAAEKVKFVLGSY